MLILIATPIGHLADMNFRAIEALKASDLILCEDTRVSAVLLSHYGIEKPLYSYHKFNEGRKLEPILKRLREGAKVALISDAGTPCLNDPGALLVKACIEANLAFTAIPGACSPILALLLSGFDASHFQCIGFLPRKPLKALRKALSYPGTTIAFESPERLLDTLAHLANLAPDRPLAVAREMTKIHEECRRGTAHEILTHFQKQGVRGEVCLVLAAGRLPAESMPLEELICELQSCHNLSLKEAIKLAAHLLQRPKREIYHTLNY